MANEQKIWGIHAGNLGQVDKMFLNDKESCVALGWDNIGDLKRLKNDRDAFKDALIKAYPDTKSGAVPTSAGMLYRFMYEVGLNDIIVYPSKIDKLVHIGQFTSEYQFRRDMNKDYPQVRFVNWKKHVPRSVLSQGALYEMGSALSFFQIKNFADEILDIIGGKIKNTSSADGKDDGTIAAVAENIEENTRDFILKRLFKELKGFPFEHFIAHLLNLMGYRTRVSAQGGDGGIDIIAHKDELGFEPPIIKVQVKSKDDIVKHNDVQALYGNVGAGEYGLFISLSDFNKQAKDFAKSKTNLRLISGYDLVDIILEHYEEIDSKYKAKISLKNVYIPVQVDVEQ